MKVKTRVRYILTGADFSQQEPRLLSQFSKDHNMINAYKNGKDLYATIAMGVYHNKYEDNLELYPDGTLNAEGKKRRGNCKSLLLGIMYGRGTASIAEQIHGTVEEAQAIVDNFYKSFPEVKKWMDDSEKSAQEKGYVEDLWGRRRRLNDINLPPYTVRYKKKEGGENAENILANKLFNPFLWVEDRTDDANLNKYKNLLENARNRKQLDYIKSTADKEGIEIINNGGFISTAKRQCVNARIQGSAATMTKRAMIRLYHDKRLQDLDFHVEIGVHDELIGECPLENLDKVNELLSYDMRIAAKGYVEVPFKCDTDSSFNWYWNDYKSVVLQEFRDLLKGNEAKGIKPLNNKEAFEKIVENHIELTRENLYDVVEGYDLN